MHIHHVALRTRAIDRLVAFYGDVLGLEVTRREPGRSVWLRAGDAILMIEAADASEPAPVADSREMVAFCIESRERDAFIARLAGAGVAIESQSAYTLYVRDPDGRRVGLSHYPEPEP